MGGAGGGGGEMGGFASFIPLILMFAVFYFLLIRPQQKRAKEHQNMLSNVKRGDEVVTAGGLIGRILETTEQYLVVDLGDTKVKVSRNAISAVTGQSKIVDKTAKKADKNAAREKADESAAKEKADANTAGDDSDTSEK